MQRLRRHIAICAVQVVSPAPPSVGIGPLTALLPLAVVLFVRVLCRDSVDVSLRLRPAERDPRRIDRSFLTSRRSFKAGILLNRQRLMKNIAFYNSGTMQLDAISMDRSLHTSANGQFFREDVTLNFCAIADQNGRGMDFTLNMSGNFQSPFASNFANDYDGGADRRNLVRRFDSLRGYDWRGLKLLDWGR